MVIAIDLYGSVICDQMVGKDFYCQEQCADCHGYFYRDELRRDADGSFICRSCHLRQILLKRRRPRIFDITIPVPFGVSLIDILAVVLILSLLTGITVPSIMYLRQKALETELEQLFYTNRDTDLGRLAAQAVSISEEGLLLGDIPEFSQAEPEELEQLEYKLRECLGFDTDELKIGATIKAIEEWQQNLEICQFYDDLTQSTTVP